MLLDTNPSGLTCFTVTTSTPSAFLTSHLTTTNLPVTTPRTCWPLVKLISNLHRVWFPSQVSVACDVCILSGRQIILKTFSGNYQENFRETAFDQRKRREKIFRTIRFARRRDSNLGEPVPTMAHVARFPPIPDRRLRERIREPRYRAGLGEACCYLP